MAEQARITAGTDLRSGPIRRRPGGAPTNGLRAWWLANHNNSAQTVLSGGAERSPKRAEVRDRGVSTTAHVSDGFSFAHVGAGRAQFRSFRGDCFQAARLESLPMRSRALPGRRAAMRELVARQLVSPVRCGRSRRCNTRRPHLRRVGPGAPHRASGHILKKRPHKAVALGADPCWSGLDRALGGGGADLLRAALEGHARRRTRASREAADCR